MFSCEFLLRPAKAVLSRLGAYLLGPISSCPFAAGVLAPSELILGEHWPLVRSEMVGGWEWNDETLVVVFCEDVVAGDAGHGVLCLRMGGGSRVGNLFWVKVAFCRRKGKWSSIQVCCLA